MPEETEATESTEAVDNLETSTEVPQEPAYTVKIDGEEQQVSLEELQQGYQRQADYTRKTQEIAAERDRLQQAEAIVSALEHDPEGTLQTLAHSFNVAPITGQQVSDDEYAEVDPTQQKLAELEQKIARQEQIERVQRVEREVSTLQEKYGEFNREELLNHALKNGIPNLEAAYTHMRFNDVKSTADKLSQEQEITNKKREAAVVTPGGSTQSGVETEPTPKVSSLREAFALAKQQLGN
jgi:TolA-binding protein|tara:strand:- start:1458 stop:2174 length:717 start_codon:yes stop_codon:yes gene_type:complete